MSIGIFIEKNNIPTEMEIQEKIGSSITAWQSIIKYINENFRTKSEYKFYGKNYGWALRFIKSGKSFIALYPGENKFTIQIILNEIQIEKALNIEIQQNIKEIIQKTPLIHEGKWIYIEVFSDSDLSDIEKLLSIRGK